MSPASLHSTPVCLYSRHTSFLSVPWMEPRHMLFPLLFPFHFWLQFSFHLADSYLIYRSQLKHHFLQEAPYTHRLKVKVKSLSRVWLFETLWTLAHQAPPSMGFSKQEYWSGLPFPSTGDLPDPRIEPGSLTRSALAGGFFTTSTHLQSPFLFGG